MDGDHRQPNDEWTCQRPSRLRVAAVSAATRVAAGMQIVCGDHSRDGFGILMYHRVAERTPGVPTPTLNVTPRQLRRQLSGLLSRGFEAWPLSSLVRAHCERQAIPANAFAVTFDDGYENNFLNAGPILRELKVPATIFVATQYLDTDRPFPFDDWSATGSSRVSPPAWRPLSTKQCDEIRAEGLIELGAHTHSHRRFLGRKDDFRRDMSECLNVLRERFGIERPTFAFPYGELSPELIDVAMEVGVACCLSTRQLKVCAADDPRNWGRFEATASDSPAALAAKLSGWYTAVASAGKSIVRPLRKREHRTNLQSEGRLQDAPRRELPRASEALSTP
jgi:peptidoglycan/xylan/chitin deacetylase (PgdA/CDA1 family)